MGRPMKPRGIDAANMIAGYQTMIADTRKMIEIDGGLATDLNKIRETRVKHYADMITRLQSSGAYARPKQVGSRLILCTCTCGYKVRTTMHWITVAVPRCPQKKTRNPTHHLDKRGGYTIGCERGGQPMEIEAPRAEKEIIETLSTPEGVAKVEEQRKQTIAEAEKELQDFFYGKNTPAAKEMEEWLKPTEEK